MTSDTGRPTRPLPQPDDASQGYWLAAARGELALPRCSRCGSFSLPPSLVCGGCGTTSPGYTYAAVDGTGTLRSWTIVRDAFLPGFAEDVPYVLVDVELDAQRDLRMIGRLVDGASAALQVGDRVAVTFEQVTDGVAVPAFTRMKQ